MEEKMKIRLIKRGDGKYEVQRWIHMTSGYNLTNNGVAESFSLEEWVGDKVFKTKFSANRYIKWLKNYCIKLAKEKELEKQFTVIREDEV